MEFGSAVRQIFYMRYPLFFGLVLAGLGPFSWYLMPQLLGNVLIVHRPLQIAFLTLICLMMSMMLAAQIWVITTNGPHRFKADWGSLYEQAKAQDGEASQLTGFSRFLKRVAGFLSARPFEPVWKWSWFGTLVWLLVGLSLPVTAILYSNSTNSKAASDIGFPDNVEIPGGFAGIAGGFLMFVVVLVATAYISERLLYTKLQSERLLPIRVLNAENQDRTFYDIGNHLAKFLACSKNPTVNNGYAYVKTGEDGKQHGYLAQGHAQLFVFLFVMLIFYAGVYLFGNAGVGAGNPTQKWLPTMFYAVLLLMFISLMFSATSFFVDLFRFPTLLILPLVLFLGFWGSDHYFNVDLQTEIPTEKQAEVSEAVKQKAARFEKTMQQQYLTKSIPSDLQSKKTLVVITAPGGGIHAAAWTARVLVGLHGRYQPEFAESIGMISSVSGGSVGSMYYLNAYPQLMEAAKSGNDEKFKELAKQVFLNSTASSLEPVGWGLAFPDFANFVALGKVITFHGDRAETVEQYWNQLLTGGRDAEPPSLRTWGEMVTNKQLPGFVFNATEVETGRRVLFTTIPIKTRPELDRRRLSPRSFRDLYIDNGVGPHGDINISTCVRLSATFPYVFPSARSQHIGSSEEQREGLGHVVDGGYIDNEGIITAVDWLSRSIEEQNANEGHEGQKKFDRVVLIRIRHHPIAKSERETADDELLKPDRNLPPLQSGFGSALVAPLSAVIHVRDASQIERGQIEAELVQFDSNSLTPVFLDYDPGDEMDHAPLNWKLTPQQVATYEKAWNNLTESSGIAELDRIFKKKSSD